MKRLFIALLAVCILVCGASCSSVNNEPKPKLTLEDISKVLDFKDKIPGYLYETRDLIKDDTPPDLLGEDIAYIFYEYTGLTVDNKFLYHALSFQLFIVDDYDVNRMDLLDVIQRISITDGMEYEYLDCGSNANVGCYFAEMAEECWIKMDNCYVRMIHLYVNVKENDNFSLKTFSPIIVDRLDKYSLS